MEGGAGAPLGLPNPFPFIQSLPFLFIHSFYILISFHSDVIPFYHSGNWEEAGYACDGYLPLPAGCQCLSAWSACLHSAAACLPVWSAV